MKKFGGFIEKIFTGKNKINNKFFTINGRSSFQIILNTLNPKKIYLPFYICKDIIDILKKNKIPYDFYAIDRSFNIKKKIKTKKNEYVLIVNYFGLSKITKNDKNIYDYSLSLFDFKKNISPCFISLRKFINAGYGSFLNIKNINKRYIKKTPPKNLLESPKKFNQFKSNEKKQKIDENIYLSKYLDKDIINTDFKNIKKKRNQNYKTYHKYLMNINRLNLPNNPIGPLYYPFLINNGYEIIKKLNKKNIYTPVLWDHINKYKNTNYSFEKDLAQNCIFLPLDQRYNTNDIQYIISNLTKNF